MQRGRVFNDRREAGRVLARELERFGGRDDVVVLALPRGGVPVGYEVAEALEAPLDVFIVRKLGLPSQPELAVGAIASGGIRVLNEEVVRLTGLSEDQIAAIAADETEELERRERAYRRNQSRVDLRGRVVILVDDGVATGSTTRAALAALRSEDPARVVLAVPVAPAETCEDLAARADEVVCAMTPDPFGAISLWYEEFPQLTDDEVRGYLERAPTIS